MTLETLLRLGRVSNLPTVWSNVLCGMVIGQAVVAEHVLTLVALLFSSSLLYVGGMFLNDAFDADVDRKERPERPIPAGQATAREVFFLGFRLLISAILVLAAALVIAGRAQFTALLAALMTSVAIVAYNRWHKGHAWAPMVMGLCRAGLYCMAALAVTDEPGWTLLAASGALWLYVVGLTHAARFETGSVVHRAWVLGALFAPLGFALVLPWQQPWVAVFAVGLALWIVHALRLLLSRKPGGIGRGIVSLIAGISLVDALFISLWGSPLLALFAIGAFAATLIGQRRIAGT